MGLGLSAVGLVFGATKLFDVVTDPIFGSLSDRVRTPFGRRRPWFVLSVPLMIFCTWKIFLPSAGVGIGYFATWMVLLYVGWTLVTISHLAWAAELSTDYHERSRISAFKQAAGLIGGIAAISIPVLIDSAGSADPVAADRIAALGLFVMIVLPITALIALLTTPEHPVPNATPPRESKTALEGVRGFLGSGPLRSLLTANLCLGLAVGSTGSMLFFYVDRVLLLGRWSTFAMLPFLLSGLLFLPAWMALSRRIGKHRTLVFAMVYQLLVSPLLVFLPAESLGLTLAAFMLVGASNAVGNFIPPALMADVSDVDTAKTGLARTGLHMSVLQSSSKIAAALALAVTYPLLSAVGFDPSPEAQNSSAALAGLRALIVLLPASFFGTVLLVMRSYPIDEALQAEVRREIDSLAQASASAAGD